MKLSNAALRNQILKILNPGEEVYRAPMSDIELKNRLAKEYLANGFEGFREMDMDISGYISLRSSSNIN